jgi:phage gpG-like protein
MSAKMVMNDAKKAKLALMKQRLGRPLAITQAVAEVIHRESVLAFTRQVGPYGEWKPTKRVELSAAKMPKNLSPGKRKAYKKAGPQILIKTHTMQNSIKWRLLTPGSFALSVVKYGTYHLFGAPETNLPARPWTVRKDLGVPETMLAILRRRIVPILKGEVPF